jgi:hypothetical protein
MNALAINAGIVANPRISPKPTKNSPQGIRMLKNSILGKANPSRKLAYHPRTVGFSMVPCKKPPASNPDFIFE